MKRRGAVLVAVVAVLVTLLPSPASAAAGDRRDDYNRDGVSDLLAINKSPGQPDDGCLYRWYGNGGGGVGAAARIGCGWNAYEPAAVGDMNSDGNGDVMALTAAGSRPACLRRWWGDSQGGFAPAAVINCGDWHRYRDITAAGDINRDGKPDLVGIRRDTGCLYHWYGDGRGGFGTGASFECGWSAFEDLTGLTDLNEDGIGDLMGRLPLGNGEYALYTWRNSGFGDYSQGRELGRSGWASMDLI
jgi:hypothetical protein